MKRWMVKKAGVAVLTAATGWGVLSSGTGWGQDPGSGASQIQRGLSELFERDGRRIPQPAAKPHPNPAPAPSRPQTDAHVPQPLPTWGTLSRSALPNVPGPAASHPVIQPAKPKSASPSTAGSRLPAGIQAPVRSESPKMTNAPLAPPKPLITPRPTPIESELAPPVPAIRNLPVAKGTAPAEEAPKAIPLPKTASSAFPEVQELPGASEDPFSHPFAQTVSKPAAKVHPLDTPEAKDEPQTVVKTQAEPAVEIDPFEMPAVKEESHGPKPHPVAKTESKPELALPKGHPFEMPDVQEVPPPPEPDDNPFAQTDAKPAAEPAGANPFKMPVVKESGKAPLPQPVAKTESKPLPAPPKANPFEMPEVTPAPNAPQVQPVAKGEAKPAAGLPEIHPFELPEFKSEPEAPKAPPTAEAEPKAEPTFEMPTLAKPAPKEKSPAPVVFTPPITELEDEAAQPASSKPVADEKPVVQTPPAAKPQPAVQKPAGPAPVRGNPFAIIAGPPAAKPEPKAEPVVQKPAAPPQAMPAAAMNGCCPVTLRHDRKMVQGRREHTSQWQGTLYQFASAEAKQQFDNEPERYAPAHGGKDVTLLTDTGKDVAGSLEHSVWYHRKLYLFQSAATRQAFQANPGKYVAPAPQTQPVVHFEPQVQPKAASARPGFDPFKMPEVRGIPQADPEPRTLVAGMKGCCPVTLRHDRKMVQGRREHTSQWQGTLYQFASAEAKEQFDRQPDYFAPAAAGNDVTLLADAGKLVAGSLEHAVWYHRQLYLFESAATQASFQANPEKYLSVK